MTPGIYYVQFSSGPNSMGTGLVVVSNGDINGGDDAFLYRGQVDEYNGQAKARIQVNHYRGEPNSVFGPLRSFALELSGNGDEQSFDLHGGIVGAPGQMIRIVGRKVAPLYERGT